MSVFRLAQPTKAGGGGPTGEDNQAMELQLRNVKVASRRGSTEDRSQIVHVRVISAAVGYDRRRH